MYSGRVKIYSGKQYEVVSFGRGAAYEIIRADGHTRWVQDEDASIFGDELERTNEVYTIEDVCADYF